MQLSEQEVVRREKLARLRELGINPYPANLYPLDTNSKQIKSDFEEAGDEDVFRKIRGDLDAKNIEQSDHQIRRTMDELMAKAERQIEDEG